MIISFFALLLWLSRSWIVSFSLIKLSGIFFLLIFQGIRYLSRDTVIIFDPCQGTLKTLGFSLLSFISFDFSILVLLSDKLTDEIDLYYLVFIRVFCFSSFRNHWFIQIPWLIQCHTLVWFIYFWYIFFTFRCLWFVCFVECIDFIIFLWWVMAVSTTFRFISI